MGNDGGSIPKRRELVKNAARNPTVSELKATAHESLAHAWSHDPLTTEPLDLENIVSDWRGRLYNYESILKALLPSDDKADDAELTPPNGESPEVRFSSTGIKSLRDVVKLKFKRYAPPGAKGNDIWACPVSLKELGPSTRSVYIVPCGHVFAEAAIKQIDEKVCPECSEAFEASDVIPVLPTEKADIEKLTARLDALKAKGLAHSLKKDKSASKKKRKAEGEAGDKEAKKEKGDAGPKQDSSSRLKNINNPMTATLTAKVLAEQDEKNKRRRLAAQG
ncbi:Rtf2 RING-finger-domain-containing protein [Podospora aff. communis PSN243]|uniref:Rtf2 RING-finger-domain-containing protein n=1 Tax=Podospora aff. communis PSN243 TaxID=3040156 RepID=A0AAV9GQ48_9PEZI|nr:Rtf2 RING-finger-domain-containing protein [Podospora aff. communis PSN243]